jgi:GH24 family phage-related lysozyme (muramidase)
MRIHAVLLLALALAAPNLSHSETMPRPTRTPIVGTDAPVSKAPSVGTQVVAQPLDTFVAPPADNEFTQLAKGLASFHAPLAQLQERQSAKDTQVAEQEALAAAAREPDPGLVADNPEPPPSNVVPPAFADHYAEFYKRGIGRRLALREHDAYLDSFTAEFQKDGFNKQQFDSQWRSRVGAAFRDPILSTEVLGALDKAQSAAASEMTVWQQKRLMEDRQSSLAASLASIDENTPAPLAMQQFQKLSEEHKGRGGTRAEATLALFDHLAGLSTKLGGRPDVFAVFDQDVPGLGKKLVDLVPGMKDKVASEQHQAEKQLDQTIHNTTFATRAEQSDLINKYTQDGTYARMGEDAAAQHLKQYVGKNGALSVEQYVSTMHAIRQQIAGQQDQATALAAFTSGGAALLDKKLAQQTFKMLWDAPDASGGSIRQRLFASISDPKQAQLFDPAVTAVINMHDKAGAYMPDETLKNMIDATVLQVPKEGSDVSPQFQGLSRLAAELERRSKPLFNAYFDDKARAVFSAYNRLTVEGQVSSKTAYAQAFASVDPDNRKAADELRSDPTVRATLRDDVRSATRGLFAPGSGAWSPRFWIGMGALGFRPDTGAMEDSAVNEGYNFKLYNPHASTDDVAAHVKQWTESNWFFEPKTSTYVQVPPAYNNPDGQEAISNYMDIVRGNNPDMKPRLVSKGNGVYDLFFYPRGIPEKAADDVHLEQLVTLRNAQKTFSPAEAEQFGTVRKLLESGKATVDDLRGAEPLIAKARAAGVLPQAMQRKADELSAQAAQSKSLTTLEPALHTAVGRAQFNAAAAVRPNGSLTAPTAQQFANTGDLAGALATMGEGVRTQVYRDDAGHMTIGIGYNLGANAKTITEDFRKAGIPVDQIDAIKAGQRQITIDQAMRLYQTVKPRYESIAQKAVEGRYPGEWPKLADNVKAVLTDLAYQTGNVDQFKVGLDNLFKGDLSGTGLETKYRKRGSTEYTTDQRRHTLRTAMLSSTTLFQSLLSHAAKQPANAIQSRVARAGGT